jgi:hypothetical protein
MTKRIPLYSVLILVALAVLVVLVALKIFLAIFSAVLVVEEQEQKLKPRAKISLLS